MKRHVRLTTLLVLGLINITVALADAEHDARARITHELHALEPLAMRAETNAQQDARSHFRYDWLYQDLEKINDDTELQIESPHIQPRPVPSSEGDHRR